MARVRIPALVRALVYATLFISFVLVFLPVQVLRWSGVATQPAEIGPLQIAGGALVVLGGLLALWCIVTFGTIGKGTPAPFDPPRKLVVRGPYRFVRNPMYVGAGMALGGAALFYTSLPLLGFLIFFWIVTHAFVYFYEEPTLARTFGSDYDQYRRDVRRWMPGWPRAHSPDPHVRSPDRR
jgi:protein-S-isoprenylcysteine O-methyltransferase Ste14